MAGNFDNQAGLVRLSGSPDRPDRPKWARDALIRRLYARGDISQIALGKQFGLSQGMVSVIIAPPSPRRKQLDDDADEVIEYYHVHHPGVKRFLDSLRPLSDLRTLTGLSHLKAR